MTPADRAVVFVIAVIVLLFLLAYGAVRVALGPEDDDVWFPENHWRLP